MRAGRPCGAEGQAAAGEPEDEPKPDDVELAVLEADEEVEDEEEDDPESEDFDEPSDEEPPSDFEDEDAALELEEPLRLSVR